MMVLVVANIGVRDSNYLAAMRGLLMHKTDQEADAPLAGPELLWADGIRCVFEDDPRERAQYGIGAI